MMSKVSILSVALVLGLSAAAPAQEFNARFRNDMGTKIKVTVTVRGTNTSFDFDLGDQNSTLFNKLNGERFDIQVVPEDEPDSGFRYENVDLRALAAAGEIGLGGERTGRITRCYCCGRLWRRRCYTVVVKEGERTAGLLVSNGRVVARSPKMPY